MFTTLFDTWVDQVSFLGNWDLKYRLLISPVKQVFMLLCKWEIRLGTCQIYTSRSSDTYVAAAARVSLISLIVADKLD